MIACTDEFSSEGFAVRCCTDAGTCGASICSGDDGTAPITSINPASATYFEASTECSAQSLRLCTADEVSSCCGQGCSSYDVARAARRSLLSKGERSKSAAGAQRWPATQCERTITRFKLVCKAVLA